MSTFTEKNKTIKTLFLVNFAHGVLTTLPNEKFRCSGKTTLLVETALKEDMPIIVKHDGYVKEIKQINEDVEVYTLEDVIIGMDFAKGVLVDEGLSLEDLKLLRDRDFSVEGGFVSY